VPGSRFEHSNGWKGRDPAHRQSISCLYYLCRAFRWRKDLGSAISLLHLREAEMKQRNHEMRDGMEARLWAEHGHDFADAMARLFKGAGSILRDWKIAMKRLNEIEYEAPWQRSRSQRERCCG